MNRIPFIAMLPLLVLAIALSACGTDDAAQQPADDTAPITQQEASTGNQADADDMGGTNTDGQSADENNTDADTQTEGETNTQDGGGSTDTNAGDAEGSEADASDAGTPITFEVITEQSQASYAVSEEFFAGATQRLGIEAGTVTTVGTTPAVSGRLTVVPGNPPTLGGGEITVDVSQLSSDQQRRDDRIREANLESNLYPIATFVPTSMEGFPADFSEGDTATFQLMGDLTVRQVTQPTTFDVEVTYTDGTLQGTATTDVLMSNFGIEPPSFMNVFDVADQVTLTVDLVAQRTGDA